MAKLPDNPTTRLERYLARLAGQDVSIPDTPINRIECYLAYLIENGGGAAAPNAGAHNGIFRGKNLGTSFTEAQANAVYAGTFEDIFIGDYWTINNRVYRVAGIDTFLDTMDTAALTNHHLVIVPDRSFYQYPMNPTDTSQGGYAGSDLKQNGLTQALEIVRAAWGDALLPRRSLFTTTVNSQGQASGWAWTPTIIDVMSEGQVFGRTGWGSQAGWNVGERYSQFPLFALAPQYIRTRSYYWLQDIYYEGRFSIVSMGGNSYMATASSNHYVRPYWIVGKPS